MFYKMQLQDLIDFNGNYFSYYSFDLTNENDLDFSWGHGIKFSNPPTSSLALKVDLDDEDAGAFADFILNPIPLVSERFKNTLEKCGVSNVDYYPVNIEGAEYFDSFPVYFAINIVGKVAVADAEKSKYTEAFGHMGANLFDKFVLNEKAVAGLDIFLLAEHLSTIVVSERIKLICEENGLSTLKFISIEQW